MMRLGSTLAHQPRPENLAEAVANASRQLGHRPAVTLLLPESRQEQSYASLTQWASKGAHFLTLELLLGPGDRLRLDAPASWGAAAVALAAWWTGIVVCLDGEAEVAVVHEDRVAPDAEDVLRLGDGFDGSPLSNVDDDAWVHAVQSFPDQPPASAATSASEAVSYRGASWTHAQLIDRVDDTGVLGMTGEPDPFDALVDTAVRPLLTGSSTVVLRGVPRAAAQSEGITLWR